MKIPGCGGGAAATVFFRAFGFVTVDPFTRNIAAGFLFSTMGLIWPTLYGVLTGRLRGSENAGTMECVGITFRRMHSTGAAEKTISVARSS